MKKILSKYVCPKCKSIKETEAGKKTNCRFCFPFVKMIEVIKGVTTK